MAITPRSLFNIILKIFGLFFLRELVNHTLTTLSVFIEYFSIDEYETSIGTLIVAVLLLCFYIFLIFQLLIKTNNLIDLLKLDKGFIEYEFTFEQRTPTQIKLTLNEVFNISLIILGGFILVEQVPNLINQIYIFARERKSILYGSAEPTQTNMLLPSTKIIIGLLILGERKRIADFLANKTNNKNDIDE